MSAWINTTAIGQILAAGLILGAGLPALFSLGVRLNAEGVGVVSHDGVTKRNPALNAISWFIFALVLAAVIVGVLFIARDFIAHNTDLYILGAKPKK